MKNNNPILAEQLAYYRARAREYDKWFRREGLHDLGEEHNARWRLELNRVFQHSMRLRLVETSSSLPTARVSGRSVSRSPRPE